MKHIDQHTMELYALKERGAMVLKPEIEEHIAECIGCKLLLEEISAFHAELAEELKAAAIDVPVTDQRVVRRQYGLDPFTEPFGMPATYVRRSAVEKARHVIMRHPVAVASATLASCAVLVLAGIFMLKNDTGNPSHVFYNDSMGRMEVQNERNETLWSLPLNDTKVHREAKEANGMDHSVLIDIDDDGINEVATAIRFPEIDKFSRPALRIFDNKGNVVRQFDGKSTATFDGTIYQNPLVVTGSFVVDRETKEFYLVLTNGRSPTIIRRVSRDGTELGEYWHYGETGGIYLTDIDGDGTRELVICGVNDMNDTKELSTPVFVILDPKKITGRKEATCTRGFGLPPSDAELYYVRLPFTFINYSDNVNASVNWMREHDSTFEFEMCSQVDLVNRALDFSFSREMRCLDVKPSTWTLQRMQTLYEAGKAKSLFTPAYKAELVEGVTYWDGSRWSKDRKRVTHRLP